MGRRKGKSLLKLGLKRVKPKVWVPTGIRGEGYYKLRRFVQIENGDLMESREYKPSGTMELVPTRRPTLEEMGFTRDKFNHVVPLKKKV